MRLRGWELGANTEASRSSRPVGRAWAGARGSVRCTLQGPCLPSFFPVVSPCWLLPKAGKCLRHPPRTHPAGVPERPAQGTLTPPFTPALCLPVFQRSGSYPPLIRLLSSASCRGLRQQLKGCCFKGDFGNFLDIKQNPAAL